MLRMALPKGADVARRFRNPLAAFFSRSKSDQYLAQYVVREYQRGRTLESILDDPFLRNRTTEQERARLFDRPEVVAAIGEHALEEMRLAVAAVPPR